MSIKLHYNSEYLEKKPLYEDYKIAYDGDQEKLKADKYLWPHELEDTAEGDGIKKIRKQRSSYTNMIEPIISMYRSLFFKLEPNIPEEVITLLGDSLEDCDGKGTSFIAFMRDAVCTNLLLYGRPIVLVDRGENSDRILLKEIHPLTLVDYAIENMDDERLNTFRFCRIEWMEEVARILPTDPIMERIVTEIYFIKENMLNIEKYYQKHKEETDDEDEEVEWVKIGETRVLEDWSEIPIAADMMSESWIKDVYPHVLKYYNLESSLDNQCLYQAYQRIFVTGPDINPKKIGELSEYVVQVIQGNVKVVAINPSDTTAIEKRLDRVMSNIFRIGLNIIRQRNEDAKSVESADTLREQKEMLNALVESEAETIENIMNDVVRLYAEYEGAEVPEQKITLNIPHDIQEADLIYKLILAFKDDIASVPLFKEGVLKMIASRLNFDDKDEIIEDIKKLPAQQDAQQEQDIRNKLLEGANGSQGQTGEGQ